MGECLMTRRGGSVSDDIIICGEKVQTCSITSWKETYASVTPEPHTIGVKKTSNSDGGCGFYVSWLVDVTEYNKLIIDLELTSIRSTTTTNYIPMIGLSTSKVTGLSGALAPRLLLVPASTSSLARSTLTLDISGVTGSYYVNYKGIATGTIYDFRLTK